jgi:hypothetical protein
LLTLTLLKRAAPRKRSRPSPLRRAPRGVKAVACWQQGQRSVHARSQRGRFANVRKSPLISVRAVRPGCQFSSLILLVSYNPSPSCKESATNRAKALNLRWKVPSFVVTEFGGKWVELLRELAPHGTPIATLWNPLNAASWELVQAVREACGNLGLTLLSDEARRPIDLPAAFAAVAEQAPDALIIDTDVVLLSNRKSIVEFAAAHDFPAMYGLREFVDDGGLMSYGPVAFHIWRCVAVMSTRS